MNRISRIRPHGFTLMEVLVALVVISIGLLGIAAMQASAIESTHASQAESLASIQARSLADAMQANPNYWAAGAGWPPTFTVANSTVSDATLAGQTTICNTTPCTAAQLAGWDVQQWAKQLDLQIPGATATITCGASAPFVCSITVNWSQKATVAINSGPQSTTAPTTMSYTLVNQL